MNDKVKNILKYTVSGIIAALFIWMVVRKVDWTSFANGLQCTRWGYIALFVAASIGALVFRTIRWKRLLEPVGYEGKAIRVWDAINVGNVANVALPGIGEFLRCGYVAGGKAGYEKALGTIVMERVWDVMAIIVLFIVALSLKWNSIGGFFRETVMGSMSGRISLWWVFLLIAAVIALAIWAVWKLKDRNSFCARIAGALSGMLQGLGSFFKMEHKFTFALYTVGLWFMYILMSWFGLKAIPELSGLGFVDALFISAIGNIASVIPVPSGMGPYHYLVMMTLSGIYGVSQETGLLYAVLCHESHAILIIVLGIISYISLTVSKSAKKSAKD